MLALLFLLMPGTPHDRREPSVDLIVARHSTRMPGALKEDAMQITVGRDGTIFFRDHRIVLAELPNEIREGVQNGAENRIYLKVDARAKYGDAKAVLNQIGLAGLEHVSLLTETPLH